MSQLSDLLREFTQKHGIHPPLLLDHVLEGQSLTVSKFENTADKRLLLLGTWTAGPTSWRAFWCDDNRVLVVWKGAVNERQTQIYVTEVQPAISRELERYLEILGPSMTIMPFGELDAGPYGVIIEPGLGGAT